MRGMIYTCKKLEKVPFFPSSEKKNKNVQITHPCCKRTSFEPFTFRETFTLSLCVILSCRPYGQDSVRWPTIGVYADKETGT